MSDYKPEFERVVGFDQDYPGSYRWPRIEVLCPVCGEWCGNYGDVDERQDDGSWRKVCVPCGEKVWEGVR
jgi:hypothetical protein